MKGKAFSSVRPSRLKSYQLDWDPVMAAQLPSSLISFIRKLYGYTHIPQRYATDFTELNGQHVYRYVNFHRPCCFPTIITDSKGKQKKKYLYAT